MLRAACILMLMASPEGTMTIFAKRIAGAAALGVTMLIGTPAYPPRPLPAKTNP